MPVTDLIATADIQKERDSWVQAIDKLCRKWRCPLSESMYETLQEVREPRTGPGLRQLSDETQSDSLTQSQEVKTGGELSTAPTSVRTFPLPSTPAQEKPRSPVRFPSTPPTSPLYSSLHPKIPLPPPVPVPPPPPRKQKLPKERTKAFHWDLVAQDKVSGHSHEVLQKFRRTQCH